MVPRLIQNTPKKIFQKNVSFGWGGGDESCGDSVNVLLFSFHIPNITPSFELTKKTISHLRFTPFPSKYRKSDK